MANEGNPRELYIYTIYRKAKTFLTMRKVRKMEVVKVSAHSIPKSVAGAIAAVIRENREVEVQAVGAGAANQAVKSIAIARSYMALVGVDLICIPAFTTVIIDGEERTAMKFIVEPR